MFQPQAVPGVPPSYLREGQGNAIEDSGQEFPDEISRLPPSDT